MLRMYRSEWMKIRRSFVWLLLLASPLVAALLGLLSVNREGEFPWLIVLSMMAELLAMLPRGMGPNEFGAFGISAVTLFVIILGSFAVFFAGGWLYFTRKAV
ncbi:hypothetical protein [uncultured Paenibacillus sp.]|uniref:hypothetical protein n=1 Tax=uncultured Paenibacillus sp. TaxID=227322 RepID=UPI0028D4D6D6|nr:hypothetical protein [uncultured Paenibacillus sp.]